MSDNTNGRMTPMEKMLRSSIYGLTDEQVAEAMEGTGEVFDVNSIHPAGPVNARPDVITNTITDAVSVYPSELLNDGEMIVTDVKVPDYADIQRLENMVWQASTLATDFHAYAHEYHQLAVKFTEDVVILCIEQYNRGVRW